MEASWGAKLEKWNVYSRLLEVPTVSIIQHRYLSYRQVILTSFWKCWHHNLY